MRVPPEKEGIINLGDERANQIYSYFHKGFFTEDEKHRLIVQVWSEVKAKVESHVK